MSTPSHRLTTTSVATESECAHSDANIGWDVICQRKGIRLDPRKEQQKKNPSKTFDGS